MTRHQQSTSGNYKRQMFQRFERLFIYFVSNKMGNVNREIKRLRWKGKGVERVKRLECPQTSLGSPPRDKRTVNPSTTRMDPYRLTCLVLSPIKLNVHTRQSHLVVIRQSIILSVRRRLGRLSRFTTHTHTQTHLSVTKGHDSLKRKRLAPEVLRILL